VLVNRGISDEKQLSSFLSPKLSSLLDPFLMKDMEEAVSLLLEAVRDRTSITVYGDYDADGLTATALLVHFLTSLGIPVSHYIPNRLTQGYGLHANALRQASHVKGGLLVTVDCGISGTAEIRLLQELGMKVIVTDHHQIPEAFEAICPRSILIDRTAHFPSRDSPAPASPFSFWSLSGPG